MADRTEMLLTTVDLSSSKGLELGPLVNPVVRRDQGNIRYLDHVDTETLRARYRSHAGFDVDAIVDIDYAVGDGSVQQAVAADAPFDYIVASHVIEHVPDLVAWLDDLHGVLAEGGVLTLAVPDHRCCFDALRSPTVLADVVHAHLTGARVPTARQVFDHYSSAVSWHGVIAFSEQPPFDELSNVHTEQEAIEQATVSATTGDYLDVHCWVFTPRSFGRVISGMQRLGLISFCLESCSESVNGEFFARLRATTRQEATTSAQAHQGGVEERRAAEAASVRNELAAAQRQLAAAQDQLAAMQRTRSWRITAPLRTVNAMRAKRAQR